MTQQRKQTRLLEEKYAEAFLPSLSNAKLRKMSPLKIPVSPSMGLAVVLSRGQEKPLAAVECYQAIETVAPCPR